MSSIPPPPPPNIPPPPPPGFGTPPPYGATGGIPGASTPAGFGQRLGAFLLDGLVGVLAAVPGFVVLVTGPTEVSSCTINGDGEFDFDGELRGLCEGPTGATIGIAVLLFVLAGVAFFLYQSRRQGTTGATIGKAAVGIKVVDSNTGAYIGFGRSLGRQLFAAFISGNICMLGYLWALWDSRKQTWHDKVVNSVVIKT